MYENSLYNLLYLGVIVNVELDSSNSHRDPDVKLIDKIEEYQINGELNLLPNSKESRISLSISQHGIKIVNENGLVLNREALRSLVQVVTYRDALAKCNLALKIGRRDNRYDCHLLQCNDEEQADDISSNIKHIYNMVMNRKSL